MQISEFIEALEKVYEKHGDLWVEGDSGQLATVEVFWPTVDSIDPVVKITEPVV